MISEPDRIHRTVERWHQDPAWDPQFSHVLTDLVDLDDEHLSELIETDGRLRLRSGRRVRLDRYLTAVPDLKDRRDALDAALDVSLRWLSGSGRIDQVSVEAMIADYPELETQIRVAAELNNAAWPTQELQQKCLRVRDCGPDELPHDFGPVADSGQARYELKRLLGIGSFGRVYLAIDRQLSDPEHPALVAVKILHDTGSSVQRHRHAEEATKARRIDHHNVVRVLDRGVSDADEDYIVYELVDGSDLGHWFGEQTQPLPLRRAASMIARIARGVQAAHTAGLVHCDLKPGNIMVDRAGRPKIADFGIAVRIGETRHAEYGRHRPVRGNTAYIAPEQFRMEATALSASADIYALGGLLFTLLTGELPNGANDEEIKQTHHPVTGRRHAPYLRPLRCDIDTDLEAICRRAMAVTPDDRYRSAGELADDLEAWLNHRPIVWTRPSPLRIARLWTRRRPALAVMIGVLFVSVVTSAAVVSHMHQQAVAEQIRAEEEAQRNAMVRSAIEQVVGRVEQASQTHGSIRQLMPTLWTMESFLDSEAFNNIANVTQFDEIRRQAVERMIDNARSTQRADDLDIMLWQTTLALWTLEDGDLEAAGAMLDDLEQYWSDRLEPDDRWLQRLDVMRIAHDAAHLVDHAQQQTHDLSMNNRETAEAYCRSLTAHLRWLRVEGEGGPLHQLALRTIHDLTAPAMLDMPELHQKIRDRLDGMRVTPRRRAAASQQADR